MEDDKVVALQACLAARWHQVHTLHFAAETGRNRVQAAVYPKVRSLVWPLPRLDIPVHCLYGTGTDTDEGYVYDVDCFSESVPPPPKAVSKGLGDGTVNLCSLKAGAGCAQCLTSQGCRDLAVLHMRRS